MPDETALLPTLLAHRTAPLLAPIAGDRRGGEDPAGDDAFARVEAVVRDTGDGAKTTPADLDDAIRRCRALLTRRGKDVRVAAALAWLNYLRDGLEGLAEGLAVLAGILRGYWQSGHPARERAAERVEAVAALSRRVRASTLPTGDLERLELCAAQVRALEATLAERAPGADAGTRPLLDALDAAIRTARAAQPEVATSADGSALPPRLAARVAAALAPVSAPQPAGVDARAEPAYERLAREIDALSSVSAELFTDWRAVVRGGEDLLASQSKDLRVATWTALGLLHRDGPAGFAAGLALLTGLCEAFWPTLYPPAKQARGRANAVAWLLEQAYTALARSRPTARDVAGLALASAGTEALSRALAARAAGHFQTTRLHDLLEHKRGEAEGSADPAELAPEDAEGTGEVAAVNPRDTFAAIDSGLLDDETALALVVSLPLAPTTDLSGLKIGDLALRMLLQNPRLAQVRALDLSRNAVGNGGLAALAAAPELSSLRALDLSQNRFDDEGLFALAASSTLRALSRLKLAGNNVGALGAAALLDAPAIAADAWLFAGDADPTRDFAATSLEGLGLSPFASATLGSPVVRGALRSPRLRGVTELSLSRMNLRDADALALAQCAALSELTILDLSENAISDAGVEALCKSPHLGNLEILKLQQNRVGALGARALFNPNALKKLYLLYLSGNRLGDEGARALAEGTHFPGDLETLNLSENEIGDAGALALAKCARLSAVRELDLFGNEIGDEGAYHLSRSPSLALRALDLRENRVSPAGLRTLRRAFGRVELRT